MAKLFDCHPKAVAGWVGKGMPRQANGDGWDYDLRKIVPWYFHVIAKGRGDVASDNAKRRKEIADADRSEIKADQLRGAVIDVADHLGKLWTFARNVLGQLRTLADVVARRRPEVQGLAAEVDAALEPIFATLAACEHATAPAAAAGPAPAPSTEEPAE